MDKLEPTYMKGLLSVKTPIESQICDFGIQIEKDGRIWICVNGAAFIRFKPLSDKMIQNIEKNKMIDQKRKEQYAKI